MKRLLTGLVIIILLLSTIFTSIGMYNLNKELSTLRAEKETSDKLREELLIQIISKSERFRSILLDTQDRIWENAEEQEEIISFINKSLPQFDEDTQNLLLDWVDEARVIRVVTCQGCSWYGVWDKESYRELMDAYDAEKRIQDIENRIQGTLDKY